MGDKFSSSNEDCNYPKDHEDAVDIGVERRIDGAGGVNGTGSLRGEARRDELAKRLHQARVASGQVAGSGDGNEGKQLPKVG
ncbi:hypothetical protein GQ600_2648 [Phytophthora cactorum]|nr:hypothetical protein GQ600_2648 [Phytophthora cactorum]